MSSSVSFTDQTLAFRQLVISNTVNQTKLNKEICKFAYILSSTMKNMTIHNNMNTILSFIEQINNRQLLYCILFQKATPSPHLTKQTSIVLRWIITNCYALRHNNRQILEQAMAENELTDDLYHRIFEIHSNIIECEKSSFAIECYLHLWITKIEQHSGNKLLLMLTMDKDINIKYFQQLSKNIQNTLKSTRIVIRLKNELQSKCFPKIKKRLPKKKKKKQMETPEIYQRKILPYIKQELENKPKYEWIHDILNGINEQDMILVNVENAENGFVSLAHPNWHAHKSYLPCEMSDNVSHKTILRTIYVLCIVRDGNIRSLRDLKGEQHLLMLENIHRMTCNKILSVYGVKESELNVYVHYYPRYYHFHIHFSSVKNKYHMGNDKIHFLSEVIKNMKKNLNYYLEADLKCGKICRCND